MSKPSQRSPERKLQVVLSVLRGEVSVADRFSGCGPALQPGFDVAAAPADGAGAELDGPGELVAADHLVDG